MVGEVRFRRCSVQPVIIGVRDTLPQMICFTQSVLVYLLFLVFSVLCVSVFLTILLLALLGLRGWVWASFFLFDHGHISM